MPLPSIEIRSARLAEVPVVQRLAHLIWHAHYPGIIAVEQIDYMLARGYALDVLESFLGRPERGLELAVVEGEPAGFAAWYATDDPGEATLDKLYVLPSRQRCGLGGRLIRHIVELARATDAMALILNVNKHNAQAIRAYQKYGFAIREAITLDIGNGFVIDDFVMAKPLRSNAGLP